MSAGAVFQIISNDGKADKMIMATDLLEQRIDQVRTENRQEAVKSGLDPLREDLDPTLAQIAETHVIHFQSKFKPFVTIGMEYQKLVPQSGGSSFGSQVTFSLAQFGDFFTDMALNLNLSSCSCAPAPLVAPTYLEGTLNVDPETNKPLNTLWKPNPIKINNGSYISQIGLNPYDNSQVILKDIKSMGLFSYDGICVQPTETNSKLLYQDQVYYCDFPGERALRAVSFEINGNPLDDYDCFSYVFYRNFKLHPNKVTGYYRGAGQELPLSAYSQNFKDGGRMMSQVCDGPQTPRLTQQPLSIWQKMLFWFNLDFSLALPSAAIPFGQRYINIQLEDVQKLVFSAASIYNVLQVTNYILPQSGTVDGTPYTISIPPSSETMLPVVATIPLSGADSPVTQTFREYISDPVKAGGAINYPTIVSMGLYVNNIFTHPAVHDLYIKRIGFYLVRIHRRQKQAMNQADINLLLNNFKFPIEYIFAGIVPDENSVGPHQATDWHQFCKIDHKYTVQKSVYSNGASPYGVSLENCPTLPSVNSNLHYTEKTPVITEMDVTAHGVQLVQRSSAKFFNSYIPENFGQHTIVTPADPGALMINFALYPNVFQPSGHINVSRAREFYIHVWSDIISKQSTRGPNYTAQLIIEGSALNFLLISDGSAVLRYST